MTDEKFLKILGKRVRELCEQQNISENELAIKLKVNRSTVYRIDRGQMNISIKLLRRISTVLGMPLHKLIKMD